MNMTAVARLYFRYAVLSLPVALAYNMACTFLRAAGNSREPFVSVVVSTVINIILDFLFVAKFRWGISGSAIATILAQCVATAIVLAMTIRKENCRQPEGF